MSNEAINWVVKQVIKPATTKFVLFILANFEREGRSFPSVQRLADVTGLDRKTVIAAIRKLIDTGYITDTLERVGRTGQIPIYRLNRTGNGTASTADTVPNLPPNSTDIPHKESRFSVETVPKPGHGYVSIPIEPREIHESQQTTLLILENDSSGSRPKVKKAKSRQLTFDEFSEQCDQSETDCIESDDPVFAYAKSIALPISFLEIAWHSFAARHEGSTKKQASWPATFRNYVRNGWLNCWRQAPDGSWVLTTAGLQTEIAAGMRRPPSATALRHDAGPH